MEAKSEWISLKYFLPIIQTEKYSTCLKSNPAHKHTLFHIITLQHYLKSTQTHSKSKEFPNENVPKKISFSHDCDSWQEKKDLHALENCLKKKKNSLMPAMTKTGVLWVFFSQNLSHVNNFFLLGLGLRLSRAVTDHSYWQ